MDERPVDRTELLGSLPPQTRDEPPEHLRPLIERTRRKVIVLDDDPTGTQTVHDVPVATRWSVADLARELQDPSVASYILTNSRSLDTDEAVRLNCEIARNLREASTRTGRDFTLISRSDSTLRGHFPDELDALAAELRQTFDAWVLCPFFEEGGRLTIDDVHYVAEGERLIPAAQTPFAQDAAFGYRNSNLRRWVVERSAGRFPLDRIKSLSIAELRQGDTDTLRRKIAAMQKGTVCIVNAACRQDLQTAVGALLEAEADGKRFLYRTAASLVAVRAGIKPRPLIAKANLVSEEGSGVLVVVGSYVPKTTMQLEHLLSHDACTPIELDVRRVLDDSTRATTIARLAAKATEELSGGALVVVYTSREIVHDDRTQSFAVGRKISDSLVDVVRAISVRPRVLVAKGGITSSNLATAACRVERAIVLGQILPGVPVWRCGPESRWPRLPLVVFPGNVGDAAALKEVVEKVR